MEPCLTGYLAPIGCVAELEKELNEKTRILSRHERLFLSQEGPVAAHWAQNIWKNAREIRFESITKASQALRALQKNWALYSIRHHRRAELIRAKLPTYSTQSISFPSALPRASMGSWTLLEPGLLLASPDCSSPFPNGEIQFAENKDAPPSRAYLKLWEALTLSGALPTQGSKVLDLGSSPGGWTWALHELGAEVISVDKAALDPSISALPRVRYLPQNAFTLDPKKIGPVDWLFSDVICYPAKLLSLVETWIESGLCRNFVCTVKFQGQSLSMEDRDAVQKFSLIPGSTLTHLFHNKHELTWTRIDSAATKKGLGTDPS